MRRAVPPAMTMSASFFSRERASDRNSTPLQQARSTERRFLLCGEHAASMNGTMQNVQLPPARPE